MNEKKMPFTHHEGREVMFITSYGSTNYGTRTADSDNDYKVWLMPTLDDIYRGKMFASNIKYDGDDYEFHDIRKLNTLLKKSNPTYLEIFAAKETMINPKFQELWDWLQFNRERLASANLKGYHSATKGMANQKITAIKKDMPYEETNEGYKRRMEFGYDTKQLLHVVRLHFLWKNVFVFGNNPITGIDLNDRPSVVKFLLGIKKNEVGIDKAKALEFGEALIQEMQTTEVFEIDEKIFERLDDEIKKSVMKGLQNE